MLVQGTPSTYAGKIAPPRILYSCSLCAFATIPMHVLNKLLESLRSFTSHARLPHNALPGIVTLFLHSLSLTALPTSGLHSVVNLWNNW